MKNNEPLDVSDIATLGTLFDTHRPQLLAMLQRRIDPALSARIDAEDVLNDSFVLARRKWERFRRQGTITPYAWLYRIVLDQLIEAWRRETRSPRDLRRDMPWPERSSIQLGMSLVHPGTSPSKAAEREEVRKKIRQAMELLGPKDQEILAMRHFDGLSFKDAAAVLGIEAGAARVRYARAIGRLKDLWLKLGPGESL